jgi:hypothetical protein
MTHTPGLSRRDLLRLGAAGAIGLPLSGWLAPLAEAAASNPRRRRSCILLWMAGGPSQMDTFDLKPGHRNGGPFQEIKTATPGIAISEHLPKLARHTDRMVLVRSMSTKEGDHGRATQYLHTGYLPQGPIRYPTLGSLVARELASEESALPSFVSIDSSQIFPFTSSGFLGPRYAPLVLGTSGFRPDEGYEKTLRVPDLKPTGDITREQADARIALLAEMQKDFSAHHPGAGAHSRQTAYDRAVRLMQTRAARAFDLDEEKPELRDRYGRNLFGQGCLLARRLVEEGVPFVEVAMSRVDGAPIGWDSHGQNFDAVKRLSAVLDPAWATLMDDLKEHGLLDSTLIVWMGEFGRTPQINGQMGRDHYPNAWTTVLAGGGIKGGQVVGRTSRDGTAIEERPVRVPDLLATVCLALGIDPQKQNMSDVGRPIRIVEKGAVPLEGVVA